MVDGLASAEPMGSVVGAVSGGAVLVVVEGAVVLVVLGGEVVGRGGVVVGTPVVDGSPKSRSHAASRAAPPNRMKRLRVIQVESRSVNVEELTDAPDGTLGKIL